MRTLAFQRHFAAGLLLLTGLWLWADPRWLQPQTYFGFRAVAMQYSGVIAIAAMSVAMILATRPRWLETPLVGLDKMYRLHKWLGITALGVSVIHWWLGQGSKWMAQWGWVTRGARPPRGSAPDQGVLQAWLGSQRHLAETVGEWAFYAVAVLLVLALVKRFPYKLFAKTHTWMAALYLALVFHSVVLTQFSYWAQPLGWLMLPLLLGGVASAVWVLAGRVGRSRQVRATVVARQEYPALKTLETELLVDAGWPGHQAGQFAFLTVDPKEGPHPFTMASAWDPATRRLRFVTKALGDHTGQLPALLREGQRVTVEGPYGRFDFDDGRSRQIWVGAGIGITPFIARLKQLARRPVPGTEIDLFHATTVLDAAAIEKLQQDARAAGVRLHVWVDGRDGLLDGERIRAQVPGWQQASVWFCGPAGFGRSLVQDFMARGLPSGAFHQELFEMR
ncbi:ferric reductase [Ideonella dechloratans]|uniref:Ferric reductase n=1 Tax=Ideonella dechloratans TaxID=36863 RepID=A0A643FFW4_IDEDE|nr:ferric reductase-like transmembrane domain-containing protein [Ideonella dechloratans]KAB0584725.1 ferric reductase [Ideonella dechloratans]UFU12270.1 ferric reductase-like transmembrane domain-containing protein [Ideonella dechloratans]